MVKKVVASLMLLVGLLLVMPTQAMDADMSFDSYLVTSSEISELGGNALPSQAVDDGFYSSDSDISSQLEESVIEVSQPSRKRKKDSKKLSTTSRLRK